jgi:hypothetical protein
MISFAITDIYFSLIYIYFALIFIKLLGYESKNVFYLNIGKLLNKLCLFNIDMFSLEDTLFNINSKSLYDIFYYYN